MPGIPDKSHTGRGWGKEEELGAAPSKKSGRIQPISKPCNKTGPCCKHAISYLWCRPEAVVEGRWVARKGAALSASPGAARWDSVWLRGQQWLPFQLYLPHLIFV